jgi:hypothetical protein
MQEIEEGSGQFVVACCDGPVDLEVSDHSLDVVALAINALVPTDLRFAIGFGRNAGAYGCGPKSGSDGIAVIALVGEKIGRFLIGQSPHVFEGRRVARFAGREMKGERDARCITETMNFTGKPAPRTAKRLLASPLFAPAAETSLRTVVESMLWRELLAIAWASVIATASQMPASLHRRKR